MTYLNDVWRSKPNIRIAFGEPVLRHHMVSCYLQCQRPISECWFEPRCWCWLNCLLTHQGNQQKRAQMHGPPMSETHMEFWGPNLSLAQLQPWWPFGGKKTNTCKNSWSLILFFSKKSNKSFKNCILHFPAELKSTSEWRQQKAELWRKCQGGLGNAKTKLLFIWGYVGNFTLVWFEQMLLAMLLSPIAWLSGTLINLLQTEKPKKSHPCLTFT